LYSVISVIDNSLPDNTKKKEIAPFVDGQSVISPFLGGLHLHICTYTPRTCPFILILIYIQTNVGYPLILISNFALLYIHILTFTHSYTYSSFVHTHVPPHVDRLKETCAINKSLSALGDVFTAISKKQVTTSCPQQLVVTTLHEFIKI